MIYDASHAADQMRHQLGLLALLWLLPLAPVVRHAVTAVATQEAEAAPSDADEALWRGMEMGRAAQHWLAGDGGRAGATQHEREQYAQEQWRASRRLLEQGVDLFEAHMPPLPWDPARSPGPQLLLETARVLFFLSQPQAALTKLTRLETVLPPGSNTQLHGVVQQWAFRSHAVAADYAGASARLLRLLSMHGVRDLETVAAADLRHAWRQLSLPQDSQLQVAEALSRDAGTTHPRSAVRIWQLLQESSLLPWSAVKRRARGGDITRAGREHWVLFMTSLHRCVGLPSMEMAAQQHRAACNELLARHWKELSRFGSWVYPCALPILPALAFFLNCSVDSFLFHLSFDLH